MRVLKETVKALVALPYRFRFAALGRSARITPPLLVRGANRIHVGDQVIIENYVGLTVSEGGEIRIGSDTELRCFSRLEAHQGFIKLGERCGINPFTLLSGFGGLTIGDD